MQIREPIFDCRIVITEFRLTKDPLDPREFFGDYEFENIEGLRNYLHQKSNYHVARSLGYNLNTAIPRDRSGVIGRISIKFEDYMKVKPRFEFDSIHHFVLFLDRHPVVAAELGYVKKPPTQN